jgi:pimeloyl-ACP methyl ester carboxylesterase
MSELLLEVGGHRLEYGRWGPSPSRRRPTLVFLHEGLGSVEHWRDFPSRLAEATGLSAFAYSRLGYGRSDPVPLPRPVRYMHEEALLVPEVLAAAGISDAILIGHSDGASIAIIYAGSAGNAGANAENPGSDSGAAGSRIQQAPMVRGLILEAPHVFTEELGLRSIARAREDFLTGDLRNKLARYHGENVDGAFWGWNGAWLNPDFRKWNLESYLPNIGLPMLIIQGEDDQFGTLKQVEAIQRKAAGPVELSLLPACGHAPHRDQPQTVLASMTRFTQRFDDPAG